MSKDKTVVVFTEDFMGAGNGTHEYKSKHFDNFDDGQKFIRSLYEDHEDPHARIFDFPVHFSEEQINKIINLAIEYCKHAYPFQMAVRRFPKY